MSGSGIRVEEPEKSPHSRAREPLPRPGKGRTRSGGKDIGQLNALLQEQRRLTTLMKAELHQLRETNETLELHVLKARSELHQARSELAASRDRRKEMARVIARRDAELRARYTELGMLELRLLRSSPRWLAKELLRRARRLLGRGFGGGAAG